jgi:hypothetical protein
MTHKRIFIIRPFQQREGVDFDAVEQRLLRPAIERVTSAELEGGTTLRIVEQGNIREDMFRELVTADLVIADLSIHNANVFYELGIRHGLCARATVMIRANLSAWPFDLQTDRYFVYDPTRPEDAIDTLVETLNATLDSGRIDSPVYEVLPNLRPPNRAALLVVPHEFGESVNEARVTERRGKLRLLAYEAKMSGASWASEGIRAVGRAQFLLNFWTGAAESFEWLRDIRSDDVEANQRLATIYQRLSRNGPNAEQYRASSTASIDRVIRAAEPTPNDIAEAYALRARNFKAAWLDRLDGKDVAGAQRESVLSADFEQALDSYSRGFHHDLNHFYSGINALSLLRIRVDLASAQPDLWASRFATDDEARHTRQQAEARFSHLTGAVTLAIESSRLALARQRIGDDNEKAVWTEVSTADLAFLTGTRPSTVAQQYRAALTHAPGFARTTVLTQTRIFQQLGLRSEFVTSTMEVLEQWPDASSTIAVKATKPGRVLLFTGHMVDTETRTAPVDGSPGKPTRFPRTPGAEQEARRLIREAVLRERSVEEGTMTGIAGGACGGDILFHEVCAELHIPTKLFLALPPDLFVRESVQHGGADWVERFGRLTARLQPPVLATTPQLPTWLKTDGRYNIWKRNNLWMLFNALALDAERLTLIALWDNGPADGEGGTRDLFELVEARGHKVVRLEAERLKAFA